MNQKNSQTLGNRLLVWNKETRPKVKMTVALFASRSIHVFNCLEWAMVNEFQKGATKYE